MLASRFVFTTDIKVKLPHAKTGQLSRDDLLTITITKDSLLSIDDKEISLADIEKLFAEMKEGKVTIVSDKDTPMGSVISVWDTARQHRLKEINIRTTK